MTTCITSFLLGAIITGGAFGCILLFIRLVKMLSDALSGEIER